MTFGVTNNSGRLVRVAIKSPRTGWQSPMRIAVQWRPLNYTAPPDLDTAIAQHDTLVQLLRDSGCTVEEMPAHASTVANATIRVPRKAFASPIGIVAGARK